MRPDPGMSLSGRITLIVVVVSVTVLIIWIMR
jgi:hypothetical protein